MYRQSRRGRVVGEFGIIAVLVALLGVSLVLAGVM